MTHRPRPVAVLCCALLVAAVSARAVAQAATPSQSDVRQLVTFRFLPGRADSAIGIYERVLVPAYRDAAAMLRFRGYREAESPEPMDLLVVSHFDGMAGMDSSNATLRQLSAGGRPVFAWYGALGALSQQHRDEFAEMLPDLGDGAEAAHDSSAGLIVVEYVRVVPEGRSSYERLLRARVRAVEHARSLVRWSETGRLLIADGWDYVRFIGISSLADWQRYRAAMEEAGAWNEVDRLVVARKTMVVRQAPTLSVR